MELYTSLHSQRFITGSGLNVFSGTTRGITAGVSVLDEETEGMFLVDFTQKIIDRKKETRDQMEREEEERTMAAPVPEPQDPEEEW